MDDIKRPNQQQKRKKAQASSQFDVAPAPVPLPRPGGGTVHPESSSPEQAASAEQSHKMPRKKWPWVLAAVVGSLALILVAIAIIGLQWYGEALQPRSETSSRVRVTVASGEDIESIGRELQEKQVIRSGLAFSIYMRQTGKQSQVKAGTYLFSPAQSVSEIAQWLAEGKVDSFNLTILPGQTLVDIRKALLKAGFEAAEIDAALSKTYSHPLLKDKPATVNLDGYIFPETYQITSETTVEQLIVRTFDEFYARLQAKNIPAQLTARGFNLHQGITLASIVQMEVSKESDRRQVAQVFERRLQVGMTLGSDVTFFYAAKMLGVEPTVSLESPYNTRLHPGLPPGAIANFTMSAIQAVADPAPGDYLFFVAGDDGTTHYARTEAEHNENVKQYCTKLCQ